MLEINESLHELKNENQRMIESNTQKFQRDLSQLQEEKNAEISRLI